MITREMGEKLAKKHKMGYAETSALTGEGVHTMFDRSIRAGHLRDPSSFDCGPSPPDLPKSTPAPRIEVQSALLSENFLTLVNNPFGSDVHFFIDSCGGDAEQSDDEKQKEKEGEKSKDGDVVYGHKVMLCSSCQLFRRIFNVLDDKEDGGVKVLSFKHINEGKIEFISGISEQNGITTITLNHPLISQEVFLKVLEFLYTGIIAERKELPKLAEIKKVAELLGLNQLVTIVDNVLDDNDFLNPSIGTYLNDEHAALCKRLFFNQSTFSDVSFSVHDQSSSAVQEVKGHKAIAVARSNVLSAMLSGNFAESDLSTVNINEVGYTDFLAFLEFLYTDHSPIESTPDSGVGIMIAADLFGTPRLVTLCELYLTMAIEKATTQDITKSDFPLVELLLIAKRHNAQQLSEFILHFLYSNYTQVCGRKDFSLLDAEDLEFVEQNQWPPLSYFAKVKRYEKEKKEWEKREKKGKKKK